MSRELDAACAQAMGWAAVKPDCWTHDGKDWCGTHPSKRGGYYDSGRRIVPYFSSRHDTARLLEDEIEQRGRWLEYVHALKSEVYGDDPVYEEWAVMVWALIRATPEQRARAFLAALDGAPRS